MPHRRFQVVPALALPVFLIGIYTAPALADPICTVTATVVSPSTDDNGTAASGNRPVDVVTRHLVKVTGGTPNGSCLIQWNLELSVDGYVMTHDTYPANPISVYGTKFYDANGEFKHNPDLSVNTTLAFGNHAFKAQSDAGVA